ncbi:hypothetical protein C4568_02475 [Candidatus Parcubacteria bacterium]|nr:MAG: hypothetical protein C4568_02475 [Candidatus Parcubacteria bacterium]
MVPLDNQARIFVGFVVALIVLYAIAFVVLQPALRTGGDAPSYVAGAEVLSGGAPNADFMVNRILTAPLTLTGIAIFKYITGDYYEGWVILNAIFFFALGLVSFFMLRTFFGSKVAAIGAILLCANYDVLTFGIAPLSDIGGWFFYLLALFFITKFVAGESECNFVYAGLAIGFGALFKEYAFLAVIPIAALLLYEYGRDLRELVKHAFLPALAATLPVLITHVAVFFTLHYTYLDWYLYNKHQYAYQSWLPNAIKSFGSVLNLLAIPAALGFALFVWSWKLDRFAVFVVSLIIPALWILVWPSITQRVVFLAVPTAVILSCIAFKRYERYIWWFAPILLIYVAISLTLDAYLLGVINLPL